MVLPETVISRHNATMTCSKRCRKCCRLLRHTSAPSPMPQASGLTNHAWPSAQYLRSCTCLGSGLHRQDRPDEPLPSSPGRSRARQPPLACGLVAAVPGRFLSFRHNRHHSFKLHGMPITWYPPPGTTSQDDGECHHPRKRTVAYLYTVQLL